jgi:hypothetical protein
MSHLLPGFALSKRGAFDPEPQIIATAIVIREMIIASGMVSVGE